MEGKGKSTTNSGTNSDGNNYRAYSDGVIRTEIDDGELLESLVRNSETKAHSLQDEYIKNIMAVLDSIVSTKAKLEDRLDEIQRNDGLQQQHLADCLNNLHINQREIAASVGRIAARVFLGPNPLQDRDATTNDTPWPDLQRYPVPPNPRVFPPPNFPPPAPASSTPTNHPPAAVAPNSTTTPVPRGPAVLTNTNISDNNSTNTNTNANLSPKARSDASRNLDTTRHPKNAAGVPGSSLHALNKNNTGAGHSFYTSKSGGYSTHTNQNTGASTTTPSNSTGASNTTPSNSKK